MNACEDYDEDGCAWSRREAARIKQIQIGKARPEYQRYLREVPHHRRNSSQPITPDPRARVSKRQFDRALGDWRRRLHEFDAVPRGPPRHQSGSEAQWSSNGQQSTKAWGSPANKTIGGQAAQMELPGSAAIADSGRARIASRRAARERPGKFGPRKPVDSPDKESPLTEPLRPPPPPPPLTCQSSVADSQASVVRISLADQLMEIPMQQMPMADWQWYQGDQASWGMIETPQKTNMMGMVDMQFMPMETPPDKPMMPGHAMCQQVYDENGMMKVEDSYLGMPMEFAMLPHRLFDSSPEKSDEGILDLHSGGDSEATAALENGNSTTCPEQSVPESPRSRPEKQDSLMPLMSPQPKMSPPARGLATPTPATPKRPCYVPETPSPDRMHCSWTHPAATMQPMSYVQPATLGPMAWNYGAQATEQVLPEFLHIMNCMAHEGQTSV